MRGGPMTRLRITWALARVWLALKFAGWAERLLDAKPEPKAKPKPQVFELDGNMARPAFGVSVEYARLLSVPEATWVIRYSILREAMNKNREGATA